MEKPKIALVADARNWAFANIAEQIKRYLSDYYVIDIVYGTDYENSFLDLYKQLFFNNYQLVHFFWRPHARNLLLPSLWKGFPDFEKLILSIAETSITTSVYDHLFLNEKEKPTFQPVFNWLIDGYTVSSKRLFNIYKKIDGYQNPTAIIQDGVDLSLFYRKKDSHAELNNNKSLMVGWAGNSKWGKFGKDHKGLHTLINPTIKSLQKKGFNIVGNFADRNHQMIPIEQMVDYYNTIDVYVCMSDIEGTPNPVLEAMACGISVISTDVGIVPEVLGKKQLEFVISRSSQALEKQLLKLLNDPNLRRNLANENLTQIRNFTREKESQKWHTFFSQILKNKVNRNIPQKLAKLSAHLINEANRKYFINVTIKNIAHIFAGIEKL